MGTRCTVQQNASYTEEMTASSQEFASQSERLLEAASFFKISKAMQEQMIEDTEVFFINKEQFVD
ncbi:MAG: hypothetical protein GY749_44400 [Desulfobacteraceae bacterium]|nr:hypothetical protein [Desulfobacteraceae bacterium]